MAYAPILYHVPGMIHADQFADHPLSARFQGARCYMARVDGPDGESGLLVCAGSDRVLGYLPDRQTWHPQPDGWWIGIDAAFCPEDVARPRPEGMPVVMGDWTWCLPCANPDLDACTLPLVPRLYDGVYVQDTRACHRSIAARARHFYRQYCEQFTRREDVSLDATQVYQFLADALAVNYDLSLAECLALELFDRDSVERGMFVVTGWRYALADLQDQLATMEDRRDG